MTDHVAERLERIERESEWRRQVIRLLTETTLSYGQIARQIGCRKNYAAEWRRRLGLPKRKPGRRPNVGSAA